MAKARWNESEAKTMLEQALCELEHVNASANELAEALEATNKVLEEANQAYHTQLALKNAARTAMIKSKEDDAAKSRKLEEKLQAAIQSKVVVFIVP